MVKFMDLFSNFMFVGLIVFSLFAFTIFFQEENKVDDQFIENSLMSDTYANLILANSNVSPDLRGL